VPLVEAEREPAIESVHRDVRRRRAAAGDLHRLAERAHGVVAEPDGEIRIDPPDTPVEPDLGVDLERSRANTGERIAS
jgi:hypothetical protein